MYIGIQHIPRVDTARVLRWAHSDLFTGNLPTMAIFNTQRPAPTLRWPRIELAAPAPPDTTLLLFIEHLTPRHGGHPSTQTTATAAIDELRRQHDITHTWTTPSLDTLTSACRCQSDIWPSSAVRQSSNVCVTYGGHHNVCVTYGGNHNCRDEWKHPNRAHAGQLPSTEVRPPQLGWVGSLHNADGGIARAYVNWQRKKPLLKGKRSRAALA